MQCQDIKDNLGYIVNSMLAWALSQNLKPNTNKRYLMIKCFNFELSRSVANLAGFLN